MRVSAQVVPTSNVMKQLGTDTNFKCLSDGVNRNCGLILNRTEVIAKYQLSTDAGPVTNMCKDELST